MNFIDSAKLEAVFGRWPTFHDAEVSRVSLDRSGANGPTLDMAIHVFEMTNEVDAEGVFVLRHHTEVTQRFDAIEELKLEAFNGQNVLAGLEVSRLGQHEAAGVACVGVLVLRDGSRVQVRERECRGGETVHPAGLTESRARGGRFMRNVPQGECSMNEEVLDNPVTGESMRILESTAQAFKARYSLAPHAEIPGEHFHPHKEQFISVLSGEMHLRIGGKYRVVRAGETAAVPVGARHFQWNPCDVEAVVIEELRPAGRIHDFFKVLFGLARDGRTDADGYPPPLLAAALFSEFADTIRPAPLASRLLIRVLGPVASALGHRRRLEKYLHDTHAA